MYTLRVSGDFAAAHHLPGVEICSAPHGHSWQVETQVRSEKLNNLCMVADFRDIKETWRRYDHTDLNDFFVMPTAENLSETIYNSLVPLGVIVDWVRVWESDNAYCEYSESCTFPVTIYNESEDYPEKVLDTAAKRIIDMPDGVGLGLKIAGEIVAEYDGDLELVDGPLSGACFRITLRRRV